MGEFFKGWRRKAGLGMLAMIETGRRIARVSGGKWLAKSGYVLLVVIVWICEQLWIVMVLGFNSRLD